MLSLPFALVGGVWMMWLPNYNNLSVAMGFIALTGRRPDVTDLYDAVTDIIDGLLLIMWDTGTGWDVMRRIAVPMVGDIISSMTETPAVIPAATPWPNNGNGAYAPAFIIRSWTEPGIGPLGSPMVPTHACALNNESAL